jgi:hypothetical protein
MKSRRLMAASWPPPAQDKGIVSTRGSGPKGGAARDEPGGCFIGAILWFAHAPETFGCLLASLLMIRHRCVPDFVFNSRVTLRPAL